MAKKTIFSATAALALIATLAAAPVEAQNLNGRWVLEVTLDAGSGQAAFLFQVDGGQITGTYSGVLGDDMPITGTLEGSHIEFGFESPDAGAVLFEGTVDGDAMEGSAEYGMLGSGSFTGSKIS